MKLLKQYVSITLGCALMALAFDWFYAPNELTLGGFTGIAQVINFFVPALPVGVTVIVLNAPLFLMSLKRFGKRFLVRSFFAVAVNSIFIDLINAVYTFQPMDKLLGCIYGGVLVGVSLGWLLREEATTGGTELGAWLLKAKIPGLSIGTLCLAIDLTIIVFYAAVFRSLENALYGGIALYISTKVMDMVVYGGSAAKLAYIISNEQEKITHELLARDMGVTRLTAEGAYTHNDKPVLLCAVRRREIVAVKRLVNEIDPTAFFIVCDAREVLGEGFGEYKPTGCKEKSLSQCGRRNIKKGSNVMDFTNVTKALTARGFKVSSFETAKEAAEYLNTQIDGATVGFGGSITLEELGLYALLSGHNTVFSHWHLPEGGDAAALRAQAAAASIICSRPTASPRRARSSTSTARATVWLRRSTATKRSGSSRAKISSRPPTTRRFGAPAISPRRRTRSVSTQRRPAPSRLTIATTARVQAASAVRSPCSGAR